MKNLILFDNEKRDELLPFTFLRPTCELRLGGSTIREKWEQALDGKASYITQDYLSDLFDITISELNYLINGSVLPTPELCSLIGQLEPGEALLYDEELIAAVLDRRQFDQLLENDIDILSSYELEDSSRLIKVNHLWDLFKVLDWVLRADFDKLTAGKQSQPLSSTNTLIGSPSWLFIEKDARVEGATLNTTAGPIYVGRNATVMEGALIRGPFWLGDNSTVKMGAKIYGPTSTGLGCTLGGEIKNVLFFDHAAKGHEGYLGNSVIGSWCNLGADTNCSNLKNNWSMVKLWSYPKRDFVETGELKAGLFLGDYSMTSINTMFNTGTVVGICANIFGTGFPPKFIPSFSWGGSQGFETYQIDKAIAAVERMMAIHHQSFSPEQRLLLIHIFEQTSANRNWETPSDLKSMLKSMLSGK